MTKIQISDHFDSKRLLRFTLPSMIMMLFTSIYGVVDGFFISNFSGSTEFAAVSLILPFVMVFSAIGFMIGSGGSALVAKTMGEGNHKTANEIFSLLIYFVIAFGIFFSLLGEISIPYVARLLGSSGEMYGYCVIYARISFISLTAYMLQNLFSTFMVTAGKPNLGLFITILAGGTNMILDAVLVGYLGMGVTGAALATMISEFTGGLIPLFYFFLPNHSLLHLRKPSKDIKSLLKSCGNGASEFLTNISMSLVNMLYNLQLLRLGGKYGVAAYGVIMYAGFIFCSIFMGYSMGSAPIVSYHYGANNQEELSGIFKRSIRIILFMSIFITCVGLLLSKPIAIIFTSYNQELLKLTASAFAIQCMRYLFVGINIYASSFFTALNNGLVSGIISFARVLVFQIIAVLVLPVLFGLNGIWYSTIAAEFMALLISIFFLVRNKTNYHY